MFKVFLMIVFVFC